MDGQIDEWAGLEDLEAGLGHSRFSEHIKCLSIVCSLFVAPMMLRVPNRRKERVPLKLISLGWGQRA